jgi:hypothetical protein
MDGTEIHYRGHKCQLLVNITSQLNSVYTFTPHSLRSILTLSSHLRLDLPSSLLQSDFWLKFCMHFLSFLGCYMSRSSYPPKYTYSIYNGRRVGDRQLVNLRPLRHHYKVPWFCFQHTNAIHILVGNSNAITQHFYFVGLSTQGTTYPGLHHPNLFGE